MRAFLDAILFFIGAESLTDLEYLSAEWPSEEYTLEVYNGLKSVLETRDNVSSQTQQLKFYFQARGLELSDTLPTAQSHIYLGGPLNQAVNIPSATTTIASRNVVITPDEGTSPSGTQFTFTSSDDSVTITGDSETRTIDFVAPDGDVKSLNALVGDVVITEGSGISVTLDGNNIEIASVVSGTGDVIGGSTSADNEVARYDGSTGKLLQAGSGHVKITDGGQITSDVSTGTAPFTVASTTKVDNLNADLLDGKDVGTSGNTIPLLDGANTWSGAQDIEVTSIDALTVQRVVGSRTANFFTVDTTNEIVGIGQQPNQYVNGTLQVNGFNVTNGITVNRIGSPVIGLHCDSTFGPIITFDSGAGGIDWGGGRRWLASSDWDILYQSVNAAVSVNVTRLFITGHVDTAQVQVLDSNLVIGTVGTGLYIKEGSNATMGVATLSSGTVVVSTTKVTANSRIFLTAQTLGTITVPVGLAVSARSAGTSFTILSGNLADTSIIAWQIIEPA